MIVSPFLIFTLIVVVLAVLIVYAGIKTVPQGEQWTVERFGRYTRTLESGLRVIVPFIDRIGRRISIMEQVQHLQEAIINLTTTNLRSVIGSMDLDDTLSKRAEINETLMAIIDEATNPWGVKIMRIEIRDLRMSDDLQAAMNLQMTAERRRRASVTEANGLREAEILKAQGQKEGEILRAQGMREAAFLEAEARERAAEADAKATEMVSRAIAAGDIQAVQFFLGQKYVEALQAIGTSSNSKLVLMPLEASGITGAIAGVGELVKAMGNPPKA